MNKKIVELNKLQLPVVKINRQLDKYADRVLFGSKVENANSVLRTVGLPQTRQMTVA